MIRNSTPLILLIISCTILILFGSFCSAKLYSDKDICVPPEEAYAQVGEACGITTRCADPAECSLDSKTCEVQELYAGKSCNVNKDCYKVRSTNSLTATGLVCLAGKCLWRRGAGDSCTDDNQCTTPLFGMSCRNGKCGGKPKGSSCTIFDVLFGDGCDVGLRCQSLNSDLTGVCEELKNDNERCRSSFACKSGNCHDGYCLAIQRSPGGRCVKIIDNCEDGMYCNDDYKCAKRAGLNESCKRGSLNPALQCQSGLLCYDNKCVKSVPCTTQSDCTSHGYVCMCHSKQCFNEIESKTNCAVQSLLAASCLRNKCGTSIHPYVFAIPDYCATKKCGASLSAWHACRKTFTLQEYGVLSTYIGGASMSTFNISTLLTIVFAAIVASLHL